MLVKHCQPSDGRPNYPAGRSTAQITHPRVPPTHRCHPPMCHPCDTWMAHGWWIASAACFQRVKSAMHWWERSLFSSPRRTRNNPDHSAAQWILRVDSAKEGCHSLDTIYTYVPTATHNPPAGANDSPAQPMCQWLRQCTATPMCQRLRQCTATPMCQRLHQCANPLPEQMTILPNHQPRNTKPGTSIVFVVNDHKALRPGESHWGGPWHQHVCML